jgi:hypothetical protein
MASTETPFFLIVTDLDRSVFSVEGPMTDDRPWQAAVLPAIIMSATSPAARPA